MKFRVVSAKFPNKNKKKLAPQLIDRTGPVPSAGWCWIPGRTEAAVNGQKTPRHFSASPSVLFFFFPFLTLSCTSCGRGLLLSGRDRRLLGVDFRQEGSSLLRAALNHGGEPGHSAARCAYPQPKLLKHLLRALSLSLPLSLSVSLPYPPLSPPLFL